MGRSEGVPNTGDRHDLLRFVRAQESEYECALSELRRGCKQSHWMWFIFPQCEGLGRSSTSEYFSIKSLDEARAYLAHEVLGARLVECAEAVLALKGLSALEIFGSPDHLKLLSCATLFAAVTRPNSVFHRLIVKFFHGKCDSKTIALIKNMSGTKR